jgi:hypothetical protein
MTPQAEQLKKSKIFTVFDVILITVVLILCFLPLFFNLIIPPSKGKVVKVTHNGVSKTYALTENTTLTIDGAVIKIDNGVVYFESNDCPTQQCVLKGKISKAGESAICMPKRIYVEIVGDEFDGSSK